MMKRRVLKFAMIVVATVYSGYVTAANYYFSTSTGNDSRSFAQAQNAATPWKTITKFNQVFGQLQPGDHVYFKRGEVFSGGLILSRSGTSGAPIVISAYGTGARPVINGFTQVTQWTSIGNGRYESNVLNTSEVNMMVLDGINYAKGRYPNVGASNAGYLTITSKSGNSVSSTQLPSSPDWDGGELVLRTSHWTLERLPITSHSGTTVTYGSSPSYSPSVGFGFFVQNHVNTLDQYGEWYFNPVSKKIVIYFGSQVPNGATIVQAATINELVIVNGNHIVLEELSFQGGNKYGFFNVVQSIDDIVVRNCDINYSGIDAIFFEGASNFKLENSTILHSNNCGVKLYSCPNATLRNNDIKYSGIQPGMGEDGDLTYTAVLSDAGSFIAENNRIINTGYIALRFGSGNNLIKNNFIDTCCSILDDGAGIYTQGTSGNITNRKVTGNIVLNSMGANEGTSSTIGFAAEGIYLDDNTQDVEVIDNSVAHCRGHGVYYHNVQNIILRGNTLFDNDAGQYLLRSDGFGGPISNVVVSDNIYFSKEVSQSLFDLETDGNDVGTMGSFNDNYYVRPLYDLLPIYVQYPNSQGVLLQQSLELHVWNSNFGHDQNSQMSPIKIKGYDINSESSTNKLANEGFNANINGVWCFSSNNDCNISWVATSGLDAGALKISGPSPCRIGISCGDLASNKHYVIRFSAIASNPSSADIYFRQANPPWEVISYSVGVNLSSTRSEYELLVSNPTTEPVGSIDFAFGATNTIYWLDNIRIYEADVSPTDPDDHILFEYNATMTNKVISLNGNYVDGKNNSYSGNVVLLPYHSIVLIKDSCSGITGSACPSGDCVINGNPITPNTYYASQRITSVGRIASGATVEFKTGMSIDLNAGFTVDPGGTFQAMIVNCEVP